MINLPTKQTWRRKATRRIKITEKCPIKLAPKSAPLGARTAWGKKIGNNAQICLSTVLMLILAGLIKTSMGPKLVNWPQRIHRAILQTPKVEMVHPKPLMITNLWSHLPSWNTSKPKYGALDTFEGTYLINCHFRLKMGFMLLWPLCLKVLWFSQKRILQTLFQSSGNCCWKWTRKLQLQLHLCLFWVKSPFSLKWLQ